MINNKFQWDAHKFSTRSQAPAWERTASEALPPDLEIPHLLLSREPDVHQVGRPKPLDQED
ncbi:hypothetical protein Pla100_38750 [Neorhodopirellula pilleata]|uniref:Uncharacterized protein n=1 Tax=Neorhodopirellula pilleata TaxID=2714738 RepID=A0A5C6A4E5_9BACT|nr:hypothetical protein Pla100_38750 [Neorhodopirellula pilleata]